MENLLIQAKEISKSFPGVKTLNKVNFNLKEGEVHGLIGENGAGKSSLMKVISGVYQPDAGEVHLFGEERNNLTPKLTKELGIAMIHQELSLVPQMNAVENLFLGNEKKSYFSWFVDYKSAVSEAKKIFKQLEIDINLKVPVQELPLAQQQMIEIARCLFLGAKVIIMDEPTSSLTNYEIEKLFDLIRSLKKEKVGIIYISHFLQELFDIGDRSTVLRDGNFVGEVSMNEVTEEDLHRMMVGRDLDEHIIKEFNTKKTEHFRIENFTNHQRKIENISLSVFEGEIVGLAGIIGMGRTDIARMIIGDLERDKGEIYIKNKMVNIKSPEDAINYGIAYVPEDRKGEGLVLGMSVKDNIALPNLRKLQRSGILQHSNIEKESDYYVNELNIKTPNSDQIVLNLSGGNQQKVILAKWMAAKSKIFIFNEPTRGIDVGAKREIYKLMNSLTKEGVSIILISSDLPEILGLSDRIMVMREGEITKEIKQEEATEELIVKHAL